MAAESTLDSIVQAKAKLQEQLRQLEEQEKAARIEAALSAHANIISLLEKFGAMFNAKQRAEIAAFVAEPGKPRAAKKTGRSEVKPKYWLPHTQETWSGRGRMPKSFANWQGTVAYNEWKKNHPNEMFPAFPG